MPAHRSTLSAHWIVPLTISIWPKLVHFRHSMGSDKCLHASTGILVRQRVPISDITADTAARAFINVWISRFGYQKIVTTDRGRQFESALFSSQTRLHGAKHCRTAAYHPFEDVMVEHLHRQLI